MFRRGPRDSFVAALLGLATVGCPKEKDSTAAPTDEVPSPMASKKGQATATPRGEPAPILADSSKANLPPLPALSELEFDARNGTLWVHAPGLSTSLAERAHTVTKSVRDGNTMTVEYQDEYSCSRDETLSQHSNFFLARLENTRAFRLYQDEKFLEAARGFERAMKLDPSYPKARTNFVAALARAGEIESSQRAFSEGLKRDPVTVYEKLLSDDDFAPLRGDFRAKSSPASFLLLREGTLAHLGAYSKTHDLLAVLRIEASWGAESWMAELHVFRASTRKLVSQHSIVSFHDMQEDGTFKPERRKDVEQRLSRFNETLSALKFEPTPASYRVEFDHLTPDIAGLEAPLSDLGVTVVGENDTLKLIRGAATVDTFRSTLEGARPQSIYAFPAMNAFVYLGLYEVAEGCDSGPETRLEVFATQHLGKPPKPVD